MRRLIASVVLCLLLGACGTEGFDTHANMAYQNANAKKSTAIYKMQ